MNEITFSQNTVLSDMEITGSLTFKGNLRFEGKLSDGSITGENLFVGKTANIEGNIKVKSLRMEGTVNGNIKVKEKCDFAASAVLTGDIKASSFVMAEGATYVGQMQIGPDAEQLKPKQ
jgi:cytoskeletal protein CcmA (bactofilin family)